MINQRRLIQMLLSLLLLLYSCQKDVQPSTIIRATIKDEKGNPIANIPFKFDAYRYYSSGLVYLGSSKKETFFVAENQSDENGRIEFSKTIPIKDGDVYASFSFAERFRFDLYKLKSIKLGRASIDSVKAWAYYPLASYPKSTDFSLPLILSQTNEYEIILVKK